MTALHQAAGQPRRAALMAHALPPDDQAWLLGALPPGPRVLLQGLLAELRELGIPADPALLDVLEPRGMPAPKPQGAAALETLSPRQVRTLAQVLQREGAGVAACLLAMRPWAWRGAAFAAMGRDFADEVRQAAARPPGTALEAALCDALLREMEAEPPAAARFTAKDLWQRARCALRPIGPRA